MINEDESVIRHRKPIRDVLHEWLLNTSTQGLSRIATSKSKWFKVYWLTLTILAYTVCVYYTASSIREYLRYEVNTEIRLIKQNEMTMPGIRVCHSYSFPTDSGAEFVMSSLRERSTLDGDEYDPSATPLVQDIFETMQQAYALNNTSLKMSFGYNYSQFFLECSLGHQSCDSFYKWYYDAQFGNCFLLNMDDRNQNTSAMEYFTVREDSEAESIRAVVFLGPFGKHLKRHDGFKRTSGLVVSIFNQSEVYSKLGRIVLVKPGTCAYIKLTKTVSQMLPEPYNECIDVHSSSVLKIPNNSLIVMMMNANLSYNQEDCHNFCKQMKIIASCKCYTPFLPYVNIGPLANAKLCHFMGDDETCTSNVYQSFKDDRTIYDECLTMCPLECQTVRYDRTVSYHLFPSPGLTFRSLGSNPVIREHFNSTNISYNELSKSLACFQIRFDNDLKYTKIVESPNQTFFDLVGSIGGVWGLCLSFSLLSFFEVFELIIHLVGYLKCRVD